MRDLALLLRSCSPQWHTSAPRHQRPAPPGKRECTRCNTVKDEGEFYRINRLRKDGTFPLRSMCKKCEVIRVVERRRG
jgi:hypothetical protein